MRRRNVVLAAVVFVVFLAWVLALSEYAGNMDPTNPPGSTSSYTLNDIYNRLTNGTAGTPSTFTEPVAGPGTATMHTLNEIMGKAPALDNINGATASEVLSGQTFWGLTSGEWGLKTGTATAGNDVSGPNGSKTFTIPDGFYFGKTATANDGDLVTGNIRKGVNIFGVAGDPNVVNTNSGDAVAGDMLTGKKAWVDGTELTGTMADPNFTRVPKTGQTTSYHVGDDGDYQLGVLPVFEPPEDLDGAYIVYGWGGQRFTDHGDGTVTDNLTGLMWTKDAFPTFGTLCSVNWSDGIDYCTSYSLAGYDDWRMPNLNELHSLIDTTQSNPALPTGHPFTNVQTVCYWSSTTCTDVSYAWNVDVYYDGYVVCREKVVEIHVWPVRGGY